MGTNRFKVALGLSQSKLSQFPWGFQKVLSLIPLKYTMPDIKEQISKEAVSVLLAMELKNLDKKYKADCKAIIYIFLYIFLFKIYFLKSRVIIPEC